MVTKEIKLYSYSELSEDAKNRVRESWRSNDVMEPFNGEYRDTLDKFCEICGIGMSYWEVDSWYHRFGIDYRENCPYEICDKDGYVDEYLSVEDLTGKLLFRYVYNHIIPYLINGRYHSKGHTDENGKYHYKSRRSRVVMDDEPEQGTCPLTGVCMDCDIIEPLMKYYRNWAKYPEDYTFADLMEECLESFFSAWEKEWEYRLSDEGVDEDIECNCDDILFLDDGTEYGAA